MRVALAFAIFGMMKKVFGGSKKKNNNNTAAAAGGGAAPAVVPAPAVDAANIPKMAKHVDLPKEESDGECIQSF